MVVDDAEWDGALSLSALQTTERAVSPRQTVEAEFDRRQRRLFRARQLRALRALRNRTGAAPLGVADAEQQTFGVKLTAISQEATELAWSFESDAGVAKDGRVQLEANQRAAVAPGLDLLKPDDGIEERTGRGRPDHIKFTFHVPRNASCNFRVSQSRRSS